MKNSRLLTLALSATLLCGASWVQAQSAKPAQEPPRMTSMASMDKATFLSTHRWDEQTGMWVLKWNMELPKGIRPRAEVMAMMEVFLSKNRWDEQTGKWITMGAEKRDVSKLSRDQVRMETAQFLMMHRFDEQKDEWVKK
ncbi:MAG: hypothetical protein ACKVOO_09290 [Burkholderiaceae bacterium]